MRIAVCDDEEKDLRQVTDLLARFAPQLPVDCFSSAEELLKAAEDTFYSLIFLDIKMREPDGSLRQPDGFMAAEKLMSRKQKPLIVFVTNSTEHSVRGYDVAFHYLVKPLREEKFKQVLDRALHILKPQFFIHSSADSMLRIPMSEIIYFESRNYMLLVHTAAETHKMKKSLKTLEKELCGTDFFRIHASYIVNLDEVTRISGEDVQMSNGDVLRLSRAKKKAFYEVFMKNSSKNCTVR